MDHMTFSAKIANLAFNGVHCLRENTERKRLLFEITQFITMTEQAISLKKPRLLIKLS